MFNHRFLLVITISISLLQNANCFAGTGHYAPKSILADHVEIYYPEQLTNPQKKTRKAMAQFGYNLSYFTIPLFPITGFINPDDYGIHSYSKGDPKEKNGCIYTCRGGFIDFSHLRAAVDWTVYLAFTILNDPAGIGMEPEAGTLKVTFKNTDDLTVEDILGIAQRIAFERLTWHEVASWHYHPPYHMRTDQQSSFTPEDTYSNFLGTEIGKKIAMRILEGLETRPFEVVATEMIEQELKALLPVSSKKDSKQAYDLVDRDKQMELPVAERNQDVWWDSNILFRDQRYIFKRVLDLGPEIDPWLVPQSQQLGCPIKEEPALLEIPAYTQSGVSFYSYYEFTITPDQEMFYGRKHKLVHQPFGEFNTSDYSKILGIIAEEMEHLLHGGFDKRDCCDPVQAYKNLRRVGLAYVIGRDDSK